MQKQKKQFVIACILLVLCVAGCLCLKQYNDQKKQEEAEQEKEKVIHVGKIDIEDADAFSYLVNGEELSFQKDGSGNWCSEKAPDVKLDQNMVKSLLAQVKDLTAEEEIDAAADEKEYGFDQPNQILEIRIKDRTITLTAGSENQISKQYYLKTSESKKIYLIQTDLSKQFAKSIEDLKVKKTEDQTGK